MFLRTQKKLIVRAVLAATAAGALSSCMMTDKQELVRVATAPLGSEFTGMFLNDDGTLFLNVQHPSQGNTARDEAGKMFSLGTVGAIVGHNFKQQNTFNSVGIPIGDEKELVKTAVGRYQVLAQQGDATRDGGRLGYINTVSGIQNVISRNPDFNGVISDGRGGHYVYSNWENRVGGMSRIRVSSLTAEGYQTIDKEGMIDFSDVNGTWVNCFGTVSPWGTPLTSEELYFDNTVDWYADAGEPKAAAVYLDYPTDGSSYWPNPYDYGYIVELGAKQTAQTPNIDNIKVNKLETLGRFSHENSVVMPDMRTVFLSDDGGNVVFYKFVADQAKDLSSGTLYAAKMTQAHSQEPMGAGFAIKWVELGSATESDLERIIRSYDGTKEQAKFITDQQVNDWAEAKTNTDIDGSGSVAQTPYSDDRPAFLESRKAAKALGATAEFNKMEGVNINLKLAQQWWNFGAANGESAYMYMAMSTVSGGMTDGSGDIQIDAEGADYATNCGIVYRFELIKNRDGLVDVERMVPAIMGGPYNSAALNRCSVENISNPDNIVVMDDGSVMIGEDSGNHKNNMVWMYNDPAI